MFKCLIVVLSLFGIAVNLQAHQEILDIEILSWSPRIILLHNFLSEEECHHLISQAQPFLARSQIVDDKSGKSVPHEGRTSSGMFLERRGIDPIIQRIEERISYLTIMPVKNGETIQIVQYEPGQAFAPHHDYYEPGSVGGQVALKNGGQRMATLIMYLNSTEKGGETVFPAANLKVFPKKGNAILFYNCQPDGKEDPLSLHEGAPVVKGSKWIATKWIHFEEFKQRWER